MNTATAQSTHANLNRILWALDGFTIWYRPLHVKPFKVQSVTGLFDKEFKVLTLTLEYIKECRAKEARIDTKHLYQNVH
jgi:hypothetical protein